MIPCAAQVCVIPCAAQVCVIPCAARAAQGITQTASFKKSKDSSPLGTKQPPSAKGRAYTGVGHRFVLPHSRHMRPPQNCHIRSPRILIPHAPKLPHNEPPYHHQPPPRNCHTIKPVSSSPPVPNVPHNKHQYDKNAPIMAKMSYPYYDKNVILNYDKNDIFLLRQKCHTSTMTKMSYQTLTKMSQPYCGKDVRPLL